MAITGTFLADFSNFTDAVSKAEVSLKSFEGGANKVETALDRATNALSGVKIIQQATLAAEAVERLGGVSVLTESELRRIGATAQEASAKLTALGQDVPVGIQNIAKAARDADEAAKLANKSSFDWMTTLKGAASALGIAFSAQAIVSFAGRVIDTAGKVDDLAKQLKVSTDAVQRWDYAIKLSGGSIEDVGNSLSFFNRALGEGGTSTRAALADVGLEFDRIRKLKPEEAFETALTAVEGMTDAMKQASVQQELFGRGGKAMLAAMEEGFVKTGNEANIMSKETIKALDAAGDAWTKLGNDATVVTGNLIAKIYEYFGAWKSQSEQDYADKVFKTLHLNVAQAKKDLEDLRRLAETVFGINGGAPTVTAPKPNVGAPATMPVRGEDFFAKEEEALNKVINARQKAAKASEDESRRYLAAQKQLAKETEDARAVAAKASEDWLKLEEYIYREAAELTRKHTAAIIAEEQKKASVLGSFQDKQLAAYVNYQEKNYQATLEGADLRQRQIEVEHQKAIDALGARFQTESAIYQMAKAEIDKYYDHLAKESTQSTLKLRDAINDLAGSLSGLANIAGGSFGAIAGGLASVVGALDAGIKATDALKAGMGAFKSGETLAGIAGMASGIMGIVSAAIAAGKAIKGIFSALDGDKGRDLVEEFAKSFGGFDQLQDELEKLGDEGAKLWVKLTQGVGRNNPEQAARVIAEVEDALARYKIAQQSANITSEAGAQATIETAAAAAVALDEVNAKLITNADAWGAWSETVTGYLQKLADDVRALPIPGQMGSTGGKVLSPGARSSAMAAYGSGTVQHIQVSVGDDVLVQHSAKGMPDFLRLVGVS